jgi:K+-sensing histidine kinase KdpD
LEQKNESIDLGTGLGLAVSKMIIEAHGGEIGYRTGEPQGSIFFFTLALTEAEAKTEAVS